MADYIYDCEYSLSAVQPTHSFTSQNPFSLARIS